MNPLLRRWLELGTPIMESHIGDGELQCPSCGQRAVCYQFIGDESSRIGQLFMWCASCLDGTCVDRVEIPEGMPMFLPDTPMEVRAARIPKFRQVRF